MNSEDKPVHLGKANVWISLGAAVAVGGVVFVAGQYTEKVNRLVEIRIDEKLARIEAKQDRDSARISAIAARLGIAGEVTDVDGSTVKAFAGLP